MAGKKISWVEWRVLVWQLSTRAASHLSLGVTDANHFWFMVSFVVPVFSPPTPSKSENSNSPATRPDMHTCTQTCTLALSLLTTKNTRTHTHPLYTLYKVDKNINCHCNNIMPCHTYTSFMRRNHPTYPLALPSCSKSVIVMLSWWIYTLPKLLKLIF